VIKEERGRMERGMAKKNKFHGLNKYVTIRRMVSTVIK